MVQDCLTAVSQCVWFATVAKIQTGDSAPPQTHLTRWTREPHTGILNKR